MMQQTLDYVETHQGSPHLVTSLKRAMEVLSHQIVQLKQEMGTIDVQLENLYKDFKDFKYRIHAVFMHEGEASYGHYWTLLWDQEKSKWYKFNDSHVSEIPETTVFQDTTGKKANVYALAYRRFHIQDAFNAFQYVSKSHSKS